MPHFIIEQGNALTSREARRDAMKIVGQVGAECGFIVLDDIKIRLRDYEDLLHLDGRESFIHVTVRLLAGRTLEQKENLAIAIRSALSARFPNIESLSIEVCEMDPASYKKRLVKNLPTNSGSR